MKHAIFSLSFLAVMIILLTTKSSWASLYSPDDPKIALPVGPDGVPQALELNQLLLRLTSYKNALDPRSIAGAVNSDRKTFLDDIEKTRAIKSPSVEQKVALAGYLLRVGDRDQAITLLNPLTRDRQPNYFVFMTLSHIHAASGEWREAIRYDQEAQEDTEMPQTVKGLTTAQRNWWKKLDDEYLPRYYRLRMQETEERKNLSQPALDKLNESEDVFPLFPVPSPKAPQSPVRFANDAGVYEPGRIAAAERAKLPPDALAIVQQLLLWFPDETRLYWLLAELYAASDKLAEADALFVNIAWSRQYGNRKVFMDHRAAVHSALAKVVSVGEVPLAATGPTEEQTPERQEPDVPITMKTVWWYFAAIGLLMALAFVRASIRRNTRNGRAG